MKPFVIFLRIAVVFVLAFFLYAVVRGPAKSTDPPTAESRQTPPLSLQPSPSSRSMASAPAAHAQELQSPTTPDRNRNEEKLVSNDVPAKPTPTPYKITPVSPTSGEPDGLSVLIQQCRHSGERIACFGLMKNTREIAYDLNLADSHAVDDQGRSFDVYLFGGGLYFSTGIREKMIPDVPVKFFVNIRDPYPNVQSVTLDLRVSGRDLHSMIFKDIPVQ